MSIMYFVPFYIFFNHCNLYEPLNIFLLDTDTLQTYNRIYQLEFAQNMYYLIEDRPDLYVNGTIPPKEEKRVVRIIRSKSNDIEWFRHIMFRFTLLLYGIILKCPRQQHEIEVQRGVLTHYLKEDRNNGYFLNTFTSTSVNPQMARGFAKNNNKEVIIYHFRVMPGVSCIYIGTAEDELLLNPYQCYRFVKKEGNHYFYIIHPISIDPPHNKAEFSQFKKEMTIRAVEMEGGKELEHNDVILNYKNTRRSNYKNTRRSKNNRQNSTTKKNNKPKRLSEREHFRARMNLPIGTSSFSIPNTPEVMADIERYSREIDQRIKDGLL